MPSSENSRNPIVDPTVDADWQPGRELLARYGFTPVPPDAIGKGELRGHLWELIYAMAARRIYLCCTDHLSDEQLHAWLHTSWLNESMADLPPESEWNTRVSPVNDGDEEEGTLIWLRYYADEEERQVWLDKFSEDLIPPHEDPGYDRDRFLPDAPLTLSHCDDFDMECPDDVDLEGLVPLEDFEDSDPLGLHAADEAIRADREERDAAMACHGEEDLRSEGEWLRPQKALQRSGIPLLPPDEHTDETINAALWEVLHGLACHGFYLQHTDHLTDRALYSALWKDVLREPVMLPGCKSLSAWYHDFTGSGSPESELIHLRYYASDEERVKAQGKAGMPQLPPREKPTAARDWRLPRGPV